ncbi:MAG: YggU family protein [Planctomycetaceae bacterium]|nr:YggU family protein [Planctomycetaceae bacterium]
MTNLSTSLTETADGILLRVFVQPKARRRHIVGMHQDRLKLSVTEPPDKGKANSGVIALLSEILEIPKSSITLVRGEISRQKDILLKGISPEIAIERIRLQLPHN